MNPLQEKFIWRAYMDKAPFKFIAQELGVSLAQLSAWNKALEPKWRILSHIAGLYRTKIKSPAKGHSNISIQQFYDWFTGFEQKQACHYCGITEKEIATLWANGKVETKRTRGRKLELDRLLPNARYEDLSNLVYACYWCNNAKTDTFTAAEFRKIGAAIGSVWQKRLDEIDEK